MTEKKEDSADLKRNEGLVNQYRQARGAPSVHKTTLASLRAYDPKSLVFVCEGVDDKKVYFHWLRNLQPEITYNFIVCNGKDQVLKFRELMRRDLSGSGNGVLYLIDKDFDGLRGYPDDADIHVTDTYSFENWLVSREILECILTVDMHCHGDPALRSVLLKRFDEIYESFLTITKPYNHRIYLARILGIDARSLPTKLSKLAKIELTTVDACEEDLKNVIVLAREPTLVEIEQYKAAFEALDPMKDYRGKFAMLFFLKWLTLVAQDKNSEHPKLFRNGSGAGAKANGALTLDSIVSKSSPPRSFRVFIERAAQYWFEATNVGVAGSVQMT
ncbi:DUF4435 domain-containing protein [Paraburkholderia sp. UCT2]|uniref:DUF4435 domain-containing protein n=1 Tax=Paraburkholderia sp. UCT2 TaxID=2615208 RepID=UPI00165550D6|nr:DUF4435 domain-containing protein [Paraburkholderia sp. UCT2]